MCSISTKSYALVCPEPQCGYRGRLGVMSHINLDECETVTSSRAGQSDTYLLDINYVMLAPSGWTKVAGAATSRISKRETKKFLINR